MAAQERYSEWGFVDTELLQRDHGSQRDRESGQRATIPTRQAPPLLQQRDRALDRRAGLTVRPVVDLRKRWQLAIGRLAQRRVDPAAKKPRSPSTSRPARIRSNPASQNDRASCIAPRVDSLASSSRGPTGRRPPACSCPPGAACRCRAPRPAGPHQRGCRLGTGSRRPAAALPAPRRSRPACHRQRPRRPPRQASAPPARRSVG
jgi:hypothetical protein